ncbi:MAG: hypothetical protein IH969_04690 [Candidatus Krumholzibacteriota bacterium]|nr:hypothetical protein [Candidatus Krumholzibacteriota bacterium]
MNPLSRLLLFFSLAFMLLIVLPAFLGQPLFVYPLMKRGDALDLLTPLVLLPLYYLLYARADPRALSARQILLFLVVGALWVEGQGIHLAANSVGHHLSDPRSDPAILAYMYDEVLSHYMWQSAVIALSVLILARQWRGPGFHEKAQWPWLIVSASIYGFTFFLLAVEGRTAPISVPSATLIAMFVLLKGRKQMSARPLVTFFGVGYGVSLLFLGGWALYWRGLPEFSAVGII